MLNSLRSLLRAAALPILVSASMAAAQSTSLFGIKLPPDYFNRFASLEAVVSNTDGYGFRYFPLPITPDIKFTLLRTPTYWDYGLSARLNDTTLAAGVFYNVPKLEVTRDPWKGFQYSGLIQGKTSHSHFTGGYAWTFDQDRIRLLQNAGVAFQQDVVAPYTQTQLSTWHGKSFDKLNTGFGTTARLYYYPLQGQYQASIDLTAAASISPVAGLLFDGSHLERFVNGTSTIPDFGLARYHETNFNTTYRLQYQSDPAFNLGAVRARVTRDWTNDYTYVRGDVFFRTNLLPTMLGPSVGYRFGPGQNQGIWLFSLVALPK